jgi:Tol biopolymer transport system component/tRNA A-37 threonylcarbamoyl transferase component Bud32
MTDLIGQTLGQYRIIEQIGEGGMATVYKAYQPGLDRYVAIKVLPPLHAKQPGFSERFEREAKAIANLNHPNILPVFDSGQQDGYTFIAMRYVEGATTLKTVMGPSLDLGQAVNLIGQIAAALDYAHQQGIVHRDVKPSNVLMDGDWALLTDFGLAKMTETSVKLTGTGVGIGTPAYMSPEQGKGEAVDQRTDIYALGVILFEMLTGQIPHDAETPFAIVLKRATEPLPLPRSINPNIPEAVERVTLKALSANPDDRHQTAGELAQALQQAVEETGVVLEETSEVTKTKVTPPPTTGPGTVTPTDKRKPWLAPLLLGGAGILVLVLFVAVGLGAFLISRVGLGQGKSTPSPALIAGMTATPEAPVAGIVGTEAATTSEPPALAPVTGTPQAIAQPTANLVHRIIYKVREGNTESLYATTLDLDGPYLLASGADSVGVSRLSADGEYALVRLERNDKDSLYLVKPDGSDRQVLVSDVEFAYASFSKEGDKLEVRWNNKADYNLMVMDADGSNQVSLVSGAPSYISHSWSRDWQKVAMSLKRGDEYVLYVANGDGSERQTIVSGSASSYEPQLLADGQRLAYRVDHGDTESLYLANVDGSQSMTVVEGVYHTWPYNASNSDEKLLIKVEERDDDPEDLYIVDAFSGQKLRLLSGDYVGARFSPDDAWIMAYAETNIEDTEDEYRLYLISPDGAQKREVLGPSEYASWDSHSPDEQSIIVTDKRHGAYRLHLVSADGEQQQQIMDGSDGADWYLNSYFSPDGQRLLVRLGYQDPCCYTTLYVMNVDGSQRMILADYANWQVTGSFTSDGQHIVFDSNRDGGRTIYVANGDGSNVRKLVHGYNPYLASGRPGTMYIRVTPYPTPTPTTASTAE